MTGVTIRGIGARKLRSVLTMLAILLGVAMITGTYVLTDQIRGGFETLQSSLYSGTDVELTPKTTFTSQFSTAEPLDARLVDRVRGTDGVANAAGELESPGAFLVDGELKKSSGGAGTIIVTAPPEPFRTQTYPHGRAPERSGEVALLSDTASSSHVRVGSRIAIATRRGSVPVTVVGVFEIGGKPGLGGTDIVQAPLADVQRWFDRQGKVSSIAVDASPGVSPRQLADRLRAVVPRGVRVRTGTEAAAQNASDINKQIGGFLTPALLAFAGASLLVGAFIIFNTFSITVAERNREFAVLRTLGATRRQVLASVAIEAAIIGVVASLLGILAGLGFAKGIAALFQSAGFGIPTSGLTLAPRTVAASLFVGVGVTLVAAFAPARRATRVAPIAALHDRAPTVSRRRRRLAPVIAAAVVGGGLLLLVIGLFASGPASSRLLTMALGVVLLFVGVAVSARWFVRPLAGAVGWPLERVFAEPGLLARENAMRNPGRTATTAAALMVGLGLVVFVAVFANGLKSSISGSIDRLVSADIIVRADSAVQPLPQGAAVAVSQTPGIGLSSNVYIDEVKVDSRAPSSATDSINGVEPSEFRGVYRADWIGGTASGVVRRLRGDTAIIEEQFAKSHHLHVGDTFGIQTPSGRRAKLTAIGEYRDPQLLQGMIVSVDEFRRVSNARDPWLVLANGTRGTDVGVVRKRVAAAVEHYPIAKVQSQAQYRASVEDQLNRFVYLLYALLAMSLVISLFGIANSLFLSIHERTREFGLLRAVGATRSQVRQIVRLESVITAVIGGLLGTAVGVLFAWLVTQALTDLGLGFSLPLRQLAGFLVLAVVVGVAAAAVPARRGARANVLDALHVQ